jgi:hypothetical protein
MDETVRLWLDFANADMETASFLYLGDCAKNKRKLQLAWN